MRRVILPKLPSLRANLPELPKQPKLPIPAQQVQGPQGRNQGWWGVYAPRIVPMNARRSPKRRV